MSSDYVSLSRINVHTSQSREFMAGAALVLSIAGFVLQTEMLGKVGDLGYHKPMFIMYITHSAWVILLPLQILILGVRAWLVKRERPAIFYRKHLAHLRKTAIGVATTNGGGHNVNRYMTWAAVLLAMAINCAGASWYIAVNMTTTADLTAIYNCSTFFAYGFSIWLLKEPLNRWKILSVTLSVLGVFIVAYYGPSESTPMDSTNETAKREANDPAPSQRFLGNVIIAFGTVLYGLYEVLYKKIACPPQTVSARKQAAFANAVCSALGLSTFLMMWPVLIILHFSKIEPFEAPSSAVLMCIFISILGNVVFSGAFLILMSLTSPVFGSVTSLLALCAVPAVNFVVWHELVSRGEVIGGLLIVAAFALLTWSSADDFKEEAEHNNTSLPTST